ncbi:MAG: type II toxin-antitoxin system VapC family toxin [Myxococcaceae bacterium]
MRRGTEPRAVLDASAVTAYLQRERGYEVVRPWLTRAAMSAVNLAEVYVKVARRGHDPRVVGRELVARGIRMMPFTAEDALLAVEIDASLGRKGALSLGDRACLTLARRLGVPAFTADRVWTELGLELDIRAIR